VPIDYDIDAGILEIRIRGKLTSQEFGGYLIASVADPRYRIDLQRLVLIADDATFPTSAEIISYAARTPSRHIPSTVRFACVATSPLAIGITSMFMGNAGLGGNYQMFDDVEKAREWLTAS
jgi:hypothetical protein